MLCFFFDGFVTVKIGIIKGIGKQAQATVAYLICFYLISVPCSYLFCFVLGYGIEGLWMGLSIGLATLVLSLTFIIQRADWLRIAYQAKEKILRESLLY